VRDVQVGMEGLIGDIPRCIGYSSEEFGLVSVDDSYVSTIYDPTFILKSHRITRSNYSTLICLTFLFRNIIPLSEAAN
jgi:hypothetical protein